MTRHLRRQSGQTLIMFALTMTFLFLTLIALVGDVDTLMVRYNQVNSEALLGVQAGATAIDEQQFYTQGARVLKHGHNAGEAEQLCEANAVPAPVKDHYAACADTGPISVQATVTMNVTLPIPLGPMTKAKVSSTRVGQAVFGGRTVG
jgi:hypothetical protein